MKLATTPHRVPRGAVSRTHHRRVTSFGPHATASPDRTGLHPVVQAKLKIGAPNDRFEKEAERVADQVMHMPYSRPDMKSSPSSFNGPKVVQRKCATCAGGGICANCEEELRRQPTEEEDGPCADPKSGRIPILSPHFKAQIDSLRAGGQSLDPATRAFMETRFGHDFGHVHVHDDSHAAASAQAVNAHAYTVGNHIVFNTGAYAPSTLNGRQLLAHELTHVIQQGEAGFSDVLRRKSDLCSGRNQSCASGDECVAPDPEYPGSPESSGTFQLLVKIDVERNDFESALRNDEVGHTNVVFMEGNGRRYSYGFYPAREVPNENRRMVPGCVRHPDTSHDRCINDTLVYNLTPEHHATALALAQKICREGREYGVRYTCTTFADEIVRAAGQTLPPSTSAPMTIFYQPVPPIDNPNTLHENVEAERASDPNRRFPIWNDPCMNKCVARFDLCIKAPSRSALHGYQCINEQQRCFQICQT